MLSAAITEVLGLGVPLRAVADDRDLLGADDRRIGVACVVNGDSHAVTYLSGTRTMSARGFGVVGMENEMSVSGAMTRASIELGQGHTTRPLQLNNAMSAE